MGGNSPNNGIVAPGKGIPANQTSASDPNKRFGPQTQILKSIKKFLAQKRPRWMEKSIKKRVWHRFSTQK